ncbi:UNVERIFIED_CONTAM: hypothetical protein NCL1_26843 [Trichonephila clavipes]
MGMGRPTVICNYYVRNMKDRGLKTNSSHFADENYYGDYYVEKKNHFQNLALIQMFILNELNFHLPSDHQIFKNARLFLNILIAPEIE